MKRKDTHSRKQKIRFLVLMALFIAIEVVFCFTPALGAIKIGVISATLGMIPVILVGILFGKKVGAFMGFLAGAFSLIYWTFVEPTNPSAVLFTPWQTFSQIHSYWSLVVCFVPRILTGFVSAALYQWFQHIFKKEGMASLAIGISALAGSLINTLLVLFGTYFLWGKSYSEAFGMEFTALLGVIGSTILVNGIPEAIVSILVSIPVCLAVTKYQGKHFLVKKEDELDITKTYLK
jgi:uncharacterized membrane protein